MKMNRYSVEKTYRILRKNKALDKRYGFRIAFVVSLLDKKIVDRVAREIKFVVFHSPAIYQNLSFLKQKAQIILDFSLFQSSKTLIRETILHEIAHHILKHKHKNMITKKEVMAQEQEVFVLVGKWLEKAGLDKTFQKPYAELNKFMTKKYGLSK